MVIFDRLKISDDGKLMLVNFHVNNADYFKNIYLESMTIMTANQVSETDPLTSTSEYIYKIEFEENTKEYNTVLQPTDFNENFTKSNFSSDLFFVYVKCKDAPIIGCPPCRLDELTTLGVTFDEALLHQKVLGYTNELVQDCQVPQEFTDFILLWQAFKSAIESEHYIPAIKYWNMLFDNSIGSGGYIGNKGNCGCHGKNRL
jgi:hypothetical protein